MHGQGGLRWCVCVCGEVGRIVVVVLLVEFVMVGCQLVDNRLWMGRWL